MRNSGDGGLEERGGLDILYFKASCSELGNTSVIAAFQVYVSKPLFVSFLVV